MAKLSPHLTQQLKALAGVEAAPGVRLLVELPLRVESRANVNKSNHWSARAKSVKAQRDPVRLKLQPYRLGMYNFPCVVVVTRIAPRELDPTDNLGSSLKAVIDGVADAFGIDDRDPRVTYLCDQERRDPKEYAVRISIYEVTT